MRGRSTAGRMLVGALGALSVLAVGTGRAAAQEDSVHIDSPYRWIERSFRVGAVGGYMSADRGQMQLGPGPSELFGARARVRISSPLSLEGSALFGSSDRYVIDPRLSMGPAPVDTVNTSWMLLEGAMQFAFTGARTWHGIQPYALVGAGFLVALKEGESGYFDEEPVPGVAESLRFTVETAPAVHAGLGFEVKPAERWGLSFEFQDHLWRLTTPDGFFTQDVLDRIEELELPAPRQTDWTHNLEFTIGVWRYF